MSKTKQHCYLHDTTKMLELMHTNIIPFETKLMPYLIFRFH